MRGQNWIVGLACALAIGLTGCTPIPADPAPDAGPAFPGKLDNRPLDILFVVDNSGSMAEEQENLARNASSVGSATAPCNQAGFDTLKPYVAANLEVPPEQWPANMRTIYNGCGFIERLLLTGNKFHIGVITTDSGDCDRPYNNPPRGSEPQRGCLHSSPADPNVTVLTWETPNLPQMFYNLVKNLLTFGNAYEKGLSAAQDFLTPGHSVPAATACDRPRDCSGDLSSFYREHETGPDGAMVETGLVVVYVSDEDDCSHGAALDENVSGNTDLCYTRPELLTPVQQHIDFLRGLKTWPELVSVVVFGGLFDDGSGIKPSACKIDDTGATTACMAPRGNSVATCTNCVNDQPICMCHPVAVTCGSQTFEAANCCETDPSQRYYDLALGMPSYKLFSLCSSNYFEPLASIPSLPL